MRIGKRWAEIEAKAQNSALFTIEESLEVLTGKADAPDPISTPNKPKWASNEGEWSLDDALDALTKRIEFCAERWPRDHREMFKLHLQHAADDAIELMERLDKAVDGIGGTEA